MNLQEVSEIQSLLFNIDEESLDVVTSILLDSTIFQNREKMDLLLSTLSLLINIRPKQIPTIVQLCKSLNSQNQSYDLSLQLFHYLLGDLSQEHQYFIYIGYRQLLFPIELIISTVAFFLRKGLQRQAFNLGRWYLLTYHHQFPHLHNIISNFNLLNPIEQEILWKPLHFDFIAHNKLSEAPLELVLYDAIMHDNFLEFQKLINHNPTVLTNQKHFFTVETLESRFTETVILTEDNPSIFDVCAYYDSLKCFKFLHSLAISDKNRTFLQTIEKEKNEKFNVLHYAIAGGSVRVILFLIEINFPLDGAEECCIYYHRNELIHIFKPKKIQRNFVIKDNTEEEILNNLNYIKQFTPSNWGTKLFQCYHSNNVEMFMHFLQMNEMDDIWGDESFYEYDPNYPNPYFYNLKHYIQLIDIIQSSNSEKSSEYIRQLETTVKNVKSQLYQAVHYTAANGYSEILKCLLEEFISIAQISKRIVENEYSSFNFLRFEFNINKANIYNVSPFIAAVKNNHLSAVKVLLTQAFQKIAEENIFLNVDINKPNHNGRTALELACYNSNYEIAKAIIDTRRISVKNLHIALISCLQRCSNDKILLGYDLFTLLGANPIRLEIVYPYLSRTQIENSLNHIVTNDNSVNDMIIQIIINALIKIKDKSSISEMQKTIEDLVIRRDKVDLFKDIIKSASANGNLDEKHCHKIIKDLIGFNSINCIKYIFDSHCNKDSNETEKCPIKVPDKNYLDYSIAYGAIDVTKFFIQLGIYQFHYDCLVKSADNLQMLELCYLYYPNQITNNFCKTSDKADNIFKEMVGKNSYESFLFLSQLPNVNMNVKFGFSSPFSDAKRAKDKRIMAACYRHPQYDFTSTTFQAADAIQTLLAFSDLETIKKILQVNPKINLSSNNGYKRSKYPTLIDLISETHDDQLIEFCKNYEKVRQKNSPASPMSTPLYTSGFAFGFNKNKYDESKLTGYDLLIPVIEQDNVDRFVTIVSDQNITDINKKFEAIKLTPLCHALKSKASQILQHMILSFPNLDPNLDSDSETPLMIAIQSKRPELVRILLSKDNIDVNKESKGSYGQTLPIIQAIKNCQFAQNMEVTIYTFLLEHKGLDINKQFKGSFGITTAIREAVGTNKIEIVRKMLELYGSQKDQLDDRPNDKKLDLTIQYSSHKTIADMTANKEIQNFLCEYGADPPTNSPIGWYANPTKNTIDKSKLQDYDKLISFIEDDNVDEFKQYIEDQHITDINKPFKANKLTPLCHALKSKASQILQHMILSFPNLDPNLDSDSETPLMIAIQSKRPELVRILLSKDNIDVNKESKVNMISTLPIIQAIKNCTPRQSDSALKIVDCLLEHKGLNIKKRINSSVAIGKTIFEHALLAKSTSIVEKMLIIFGPQSEQRPKEQRISFEEFSMPKDLSKELTQLLIKHHCISTGWGSNSRANWDSTFPNNELSNPLPMKYEEKWTNAKSTKTSNPPLDRFGDIFSASNNNTSEPHTMPNLSTFNPFANQFTSNSPNWATSTPKPKASEAFTEKPKMPLFPFAYSTNQYDKNTLAGFDLLIPVIERDDVDEFLKIVSDQNITDINQKFEAIKLTPLCHALKSKASQILQHMILSFPNLDPNLDSDSETPLMIAIQSKRPELVRIILSKDNIDVNKESKGSYGQTLPIIQAINNSRGNDDNQIVFMLLENKGIDINKQGVFFTTQTTAILQAIKGNQYAIVKRILDLYGPRLEGTDDRPVDKIIDLEFPYMEMNQPKTLYQIAPNGQIKQLLVEYGAKPIEIQSPWSSIGGLSFSYGNSSIKNS